MTYPIIRCQRCGKPIDRDEAVYLELDRRVNAYHDFGGVPQEHSQGGFGFGGRCAAIQRRIARSLMS
jgi:hypothetical protein